MFLSYLIYTGENIMENSNSLNLAAEILIDRYFALLLNQASNFDSASQQLNEKQFSTYLKSFQRHNGIKEDGKLGPLTWRYLFRIDESKEEEDTLSTKSRRSTK